MSAGPAGSAYTTYRASLSDASDVDYFKLQAPAAAPGAISEVLTAMVWGLENSLGLRVLVFDAQHNPVAGQVLVNDGFSNVLQVSQAVPGATYFMEVFQVGGSGKNTGNASAGNYFLGVASSPLGVMLKNYLSGTLTAAQPQVLNSLTVLERSELFHFVLAAQSAGAAMCK